MVNGDVMMQCYSKVFIAAATNGFSPYFLHSLMTCMMEHNRCLHTRVGCMKGGEAREEV